MKTEVIIQEIESIKHRLSEQAGGDLTQFLDQMDRWLKDQPHVGPIVNSPEELQARLRRRDATETLPSPSEPYRVYDPIIAEIHRTREKLYCERRKRSGHPDVNLQDERVEDSYALREESPKKNKNN